MTLGRRSFFQALAAIGAVAKPGTARDCQEVAVKASEAMSANGAPALPAVQDIPGSFRPQSINRLLTSMADRRPHMWYDRFTIPRGVWPQRGVGRWGHDGAFIPLFNIQYGLPDATGEIRSLLDTNMFSSAASGFSAPLSMVAQRVGFLVSPGAFDSDVRNLENACTFEFKVIDKVYQRGRLDWHIAGDRRGNMSPRSAKFFDLNQSLYLPSQMPWSFGLYFPKGIPALAADVEAFAFVDGICDFAIQ